MDEIRKRETSDYKIIIEPKLLLLYSAGIAEMIKCFIDSCGGILYLVFTFGSPISRGHNFGRGEPLWPAGNFRIYGKILNLVENIQRPQEIKSVNGFEERLEAQIFGFRKGFINSLNSGLLNKCR
ncbi:MAG: hypothetical protein DWQ02_15760 [Bacteroidetes bacterium]|nr:MAG: hypothetical protein DWQ02_15760 [Bacteroidota bacterium]